MLHILPCLDADEMAECRRRELDLSCGKAAAIDASAVEASRRGHDVYGIDSKVDWRQLVEVARAAKVSRRPNAALPTPPAAAFRETQALSRSSALYQTPAGDRM
jgi:hypothetical protein